VTKQAIKDNLVAQVLQDKEVAIQQAALTLLMDRNQNNTLPLELYDKVLNLHSGLYRFSSIGEIKDDSKLLSLFFI
jgi:hypothetical protein